MTGSIVEIILYFAPLFLNTECINKERCRSGLTGTPGKRVSREKRDRGFESPSLRKIESREVQRPVK